MRIRANHTAKIRILYEGSIIFETTLDRILKMFPTINGSTCNESDFTMEVEDS